MNALLTVSVRGRNHTEHTMNALLTVSVRGRNHMEHTMNALLTVSVRGRYHGRGLDNTSVVKDSASIIVVI